MVKGKSEAIVLLLFLTEYACSHRQSGWFPLREMSKKSNFHKQPRQGSSNMVLDCYHVQFYLATREDPQGGSKSCPEQNTPLFDGQLNVNKPTKILVHGWKNSRDTSFTRDITRAYLEIEDVNVIQVDWSEDAETDYFTATYRVLEVGNTLADFIKKLVEELGMDVQNLTLVGFSLGAHVVGIAGYKTSPKVPLVIGLDPAGPLFEFSGPTKKLSTESGGFVVVLHSCKYRLSTGENLGHVNFNANSGMSQPGCWGFKKHDILGFCSHDRAPHLFAAALIYSQGFLATQCNNYLEYVLGMCDDHQTTYFNGNVDRSLRGVYYFETTSTYPFTSNMNIASGGIGFVRNSKQRTKIFYNREYRPKDSKQLQQRIKSPKRSKLG